jgi:hypothetical protein
LEVGFMSSVLDDESVAPSDDRHIVLVDRLSSGGWRLCDGSARGNDADHVVAYVEEDAAGFDVTWLLGGCGRQHYAAWGDVMDSAAERIRICTTRGRRRPVQIAHFPPTRR